MTLYELSHLHACNLKWVIDDMTKHHTEPHRTKAPYGFNRAKTVSVSPTHERRRGPATRRQARPSPECTHVDRNTESDESELQFNTCDRCPYNVTPTQKKFVVTFGC